MAGYPGTPSKSYWAEDSIYLSPAMVRADIILNNYVIIPAGTVVITISPLEDDVSSAPSRKPICFFPEKEQAPDEASLMCNISYHLPGQDVSTARVREDFLILIKQGWNAAPPSAQQQMPQQAPAAPPSQAQNRPTNRRRINHTTTIRHRRRGRISLLAMLPS